jgi:Flp pilus assembly protein TadG
MIADRRGLAGLEFAAIAPVMVLFAMGGFDIARALITWQEVQTAAEWAAVSAQSMAVQLDTSTSLTPQQVQVALTSIYGSMPQITSRLWGGTYGIAMSAVEWTTTTTPNGPVYSPVLAWTTSLYALAPAETFSPYDTALKRTCGAALNQVDTVPSDSSILTSIPTKDVTTPSTFVLVDIHYQFSPILPVTFIIGPIDFYTTFVFPNLIGQNTQPLNYDWANPSDPALCIANSGVDG